MDFEQFEEMAKAAVIGYYKECVYEPDEPMPDEGALFVVWSKKLPNANRIVIWFCGYFEVSYYSSEDAFYLDYYEKKDSIIVPVERGEEDE